MTTVTDGSYRDRILSYLGDEDPIRSLETTADRVRDAVARLGSAGLERSYGPGKWTGRQIVAHLADCEMAIGFRIRQILAEPDHRIQGFDEEAWSQRYVAMDPAVAVTTLTALRAWNLALLRQLGPEDVKRVAIHPDRGPEALDVVIRHLAGHTINHLRQLESLL